jgi:tetratricopeptide (TPR) repeat protein
MPIWLNNLGLSFESCFKHTKDLAHNSEAISCLQKAVDLTPKGHANMPSRLNNLGKSFQSRFQYTGDLADNSMALSKYHQSATCISGSPSQRLDSAIQWAKLSAPQSLDAYTIAIQLVSQVAGLEHTIQKRHGSLTNISDLAAAAATCAFKLGRPDLALEWLEQGHCLV